jgi:hypothetical protein
MENLHQLVAHSTYGLVRGGQEDLAFGRFERRGETKVYHPEFPEHLTFYSVMLRLDENNLGYAVVIDQDHLFAVGHKRLLEKITEGVREVYAAAYNPDFRETAGKEAAQKLEFDITPLEESFDLFSIVRIPAPLAKHQWQPILISSKT